MCTDDAGNGADNGTTPGDLAALTPRCAAGPYRWSMGNPAHTATQGVNLRNQGPKQPPKGLTCATKGAVGPGWKGHASRSTTPSEARV